MQPMGGNATAISAIARAVNPWGERWLALLRCGSCEIIRVAGPPYVGPFPKE